MGGVVGVAAGLAETGAGATIGSDVGGATPVVRTVGVGAPEPFTPWTPTSPAATHPRRMRSTSVSAASRGCSSGPYIQQRVDGA